MVRSVIFDLGGVVIEWNADRILQHYYADPTSRSDLKTALFQHSDWVELDRGTLDEPEAIDRLARRTGRPILELSGLFDAVRASLVAKPETVALLERLAAREIPLYCLSNMPAKNFEHLRNRYDFWPLFRGIVISGEIKLIKPDRACFEFLLNQYGLLASETAFVDDHSPNIAAARILGLHTVLFKDAGQTEAELEQLLVA